MNLRQIKGMQLARTRIIRKRGNLWMVPSQTGDGKLYKIDLAAETCSCPDYEENRQKCKHIYAAYFVSSRMLTTASPTPINKPSRKTYPQHWPSYNPAQVTEKDTFQMLLHYLCATLPVAAPRRGRPRIALRDAVFAATFKVYSTLSCRRFMSDLREAYEREWISSLPCYNTIFNVLETDELFDTLRKLVIRSAMPVAALEEHFAIDSSFFEVTRRIPYKDGLTQNDWVKSHVISGVDTNIVIDIDIRDQHAADTDLLPVLVNRNQGRFTIKKISADKGYYSYDNYEVVAAAGAEPYIMFVRNADEHEGGDAWKKMHHIFQSKHHEFMKLYHRRSKIESIFSAMKRKFGFVLRSRTDAAMKNELACRFLCHNLIVLIREMEEIGLDPLLWFKKENA